MRSTVVIIIFHLSKLWKAKFLILCDVILLVRLQEKFEIDHSWEWKELTLSLPRVINLQFPLQPHQKCNISQYGELVFSYLTQMKDDYTTNSHYLTHIFLFRKVGRMYFLNLGVKGLNSFLLTMTWSRRRRVEYDVRSTWSNSWTGSAVDTAGNCWFLGSLQASTMNSDVWRAAWPTSLSAEK